VCACACVDLERLWLSTQKGKELGLGTECTRQRRSCGSVCTNYDSVSAARHEKVCLSLQDREQLSRGLYTASEQTDKLY